MKQIFSTRINPQYFDFALLIFRICITGFMLTHGYKKLDKFFTEGPITFADPIGIGQFPSLLLTVFAEFVCSILVLIGFATRVAVIPLIINMAVAVFVVHLPDGFSKMEFALLYLLSYFILFFTGAGKYSIDRLIENKIQKR